MKLKAQKIDVFDELFQLFLILILEKQKIS